MGCDNKRPPRRTVSTRTSCPPFTPQRQEGLLSRWARAAKIDPRTGIPTYAGETCVSPHMEKHKARSVKRLNQQKESFFFWMQVLREQEEGGDCFYLCDSLHYLHREEQRGKDSSALWLNVDTRAHTRTEKRHVMSDWTRLFSHYSLFKNWIWVNCEQKCWAGEISGERGVRRFWVQLWQTERLIFELCRVKVGIVHFGEPRISSSLTSLYVSILKSTPRNFSQACKWTDTELLSELFKMYF